MTIMIVLTALLLSLDPGSPPRVSQRGGVEQAPPAPAPGSPAIYKSGEELLAALQKAADRGGMTSGVVSNTDQYRINLIRRVKPGAPLAHAGNTELHYITEGAATVVTGGTIMRPAGASATIQNGNTRRVVKGDVILVPADTPHWYKDVEGSISYLEVRFLVPTTKQ